MKLKYSLIISVLCLSLNMFSLNMDWVKQINPDGWGKGLFCDKDSNVYNFGNFFPEAEFYHSSYPSEVADTSGSFFNKYSASGQLLLSKRWRGIAFFIQQVIYDGNASLYFTGIFSGSFTIDGITITSRGHGDGVIGKMDMNGTILWMTTLGSSKEERADGICFDATHTNLVVAGSLTDSLFVNNVYKASGQQSSVVAIFNLSGALQSYKLYDFLPFRDSDYYGNYGKELNDAGGGNYFLFADCQGTIWLGDSIPGAVEGRYLIKLNASLDTVWTRYIIGPGCYYGWGGDDLRTSASGDPYITSYCSQHYGGDGFLQKFNTNGINTWTESHADGGFNDIFIEGNTVYSAGWQGAIYVPGPGMSPGYAILKVIDQAGTTLDSLKMPGYQIEIRDVTTDGFGDVYVAGVFYDSMAVIGNDTLYTSMDTSSGFYYPGHFLVKLDQNVATSIYQGEATAAAVLFPNPNSGLLNLSFEEQMNEGKVCVYGAAGNCLMMKEFNQSKNLQLDLSNFSRGMYFVEITSKGKRSTQKIVLE